MRRFTRPVFCLFALMLALAGAPAKAGTLALPSALTSVGADAFRGLSGVDTVVMSDAVVEIGSMAFAESPALGWVTIPGMETTIAESAFSGCASDLLIRTVPDSAAMGFAQTHNVDYQAETTYRALLIGQTYPDALFSYRLVAPANDILEIDSILTSYGDTPFQATLMKNLTSAGILSGIHDTFGDAQPQDVSLFYYSGHGASGDGINGALVGAEWTGRERDDALKAMLVTVSMLRDALDEVPGRKIVIIDACYSGNMIDLASGSAQTSSLLSSARPASITSTPSAAADAASANTESGLTAEGFVASFIEGFSGSVSSGGRRRSGRTTGANGSAYFIMTAAASDEMSFESDNVSVPYGYFSRALANACGYNEKTGIVSTPPADVNDNNGVLSFQEVFAHVSAALDEINQAYTNPKDQQHAQVAPVNCDWFGFLRSERFDESAP